MVRLAMYCSRANRSMTSSIDANMASPRPRTTTGCPPTLTHGNCQSKGQVPDLSTVVAHAKCHASRSACPGPGPRRQGRGRNPPPDDSLREPDRLHARGPERVELVVPHARVTNGEADGVEERDPRRIAHDQNLGVVKEPQPAPGLEQRLGLVQQTIHGGIRVESVVVRPPAPAVQEDDQEVRGVREVGLPAEQKERHHARMAYRLDERREVDRLEGQLDADRAEVLLDRLAEPHRSLLA